MDNVLTQHIQSTPNLRGGKPCISGTRIAVADVAVMHLQLGQSVDEIAATAKTKVAEMSSSAQKGMDIGEDKAKEATDKAADKAKEAADAGQTTLEGGQI